MAELTARPKLDAVATPLLGHVRASLYRTNPYRLTALPFEAGPEQLAREMNRLLAGSAAPQPPIPHFTRSELEAAGARTLDSSTLLLDEFFWLWPRPSKDGRDKALEAYLRGAWLDAADLWRVECQQRTHSGLSLHNLAVLFHMTALDLEPLGEGGASAVRQTKERDVWWKESFRAWQSLREHEQFWKLYAGRLAGRLPGNSHVEFVESIRAGLLAAIASVNGKLAAERCSAEDAWDRQVTLLDATRYPPADLLPARRIAVAPFGRAIRTAVSEAIQKTRTEGRQGLAEATGLLQRAGAWPSAFTKASLPTDSRALSDEVAVAAIGCLEAYGRATGRWVDLLAPADASIKLAQSPEARARLNKHLVAFRTNYSEQVRKQRQEHLGTLRNRCSAILSSRAPGRERLAQLIACARTDLRELLAAGLGDPVLEIEASRTLVQAFSDLASALRGDPGSGLLSLDALAVAESLCREAEVRGKVAAERESLEGQLRQLQLDELSRVDRHYHLLVEHATPELYAENAFRLTGLSTVATEREFSRHVQKAEMADRLGAGTAGPVGPLGVGAPDADATRAAAQRIHDAERRLLDEFFWLWPLPEYAVDAASTPSVPSSQEELTDAIDTWTRAAAEKLDHGVCAHNLAVVHHLLALDLELRHRTTPLSAEECSTRDEHWIDAFARWRESLEAPSLWEEVGQRVRTLGDPRLGRHTVSRLRGALPTAVLSTAIRLAARAHEKDAAETARLTDLVVGSGFDPVAVRQAAAPLVDRIRETLSSRARQAEERASKTPSRAQLVSEALMSEAWAGLETLNRLLGQDDPVAVDCHDQIALAAADCLLYFARDSKDWPAALKTLKQIEFVACGPSAKETIQGYARTVSGNAVFDRAKAELDALAKRLQAIVSTTSPAEDRLAQVRALVEGSAPVADDPDYLAARRDLFAHWLQQLALRINNEDEKYALALETIRYGLTLCSDSEVRHKLLDAQRVIGRNAAAEGVATRCREILDSGTPDSEKLRALGQSARDQLEALKRQHGDDREFLEVVSDTVAGAIRSVCIDLCNKGQQFASALEWLRFAASIARGHDLQRRLVDDVAACQALVQRFAPVREPPPGGGPKQRGFLTSCTNCQTGILMLSHRDAHGRVFCSSVCQQWFNGPRAFCPKCIGETTDESAGGLSQVNGVGTTFIGASDKCPTCGSVVCRKVVTAVWLPVLPQSRYRVLYSSPSSFYSRRMKK